MDFLVQWASHLILVGSIVMGALSRFMLIDRSSGLVGFARCITAAGTVAFVLYYGLGELHIAPGFRLAIVAACAFFAEDMLLALRGVIQALRADPGALIIRVVKALFGVKE